MRHLLHPEHHPFMCGCSSERPRLDIYTATCRKESLEWTTGRCTIRPKPVADCSRSNKSLPLDGAASPPCIAAITLAHRLTSHQSPNQSLAAEATGSDRATGKRCCSALAPHPANGVAESLCMGRAATCPLCPIMPMSSSQSVPPRRSAMVAELRLATRRNSYWRIHCNLRRKLVYIYTLS